MDLEKGWSLKRGFIKHVYHIQQRVFQKIVSLSRREVTHERVSQEGLHWTQCIHRWWSFAYSLQFMENISQTNLEWIQKIPPAGSTYMMLWLMAGGSWGNAYLMVIWGLLNGYMMISSHGKIIRPSQTTLTHVVLSVFIMILTSSTSSIWRLLNLYIPLYIPR